MKNVVLIAVLWLSACTSTEPRSSMVPLASPVRLQVDTTILVLADYYPNGVEIDQVETDGPFRIQEKDGQLIIAQEGPTDQACYRLRIHYGKTFDDLLLQVSDKEWVPFTMPHTDGIQGVRCKGEFNSWNMNNMVLEREGELWKGRALLGRNRYQYLFVVQTEEGMKEVIDPNNSLTIGNGQGGTNSLIDRTLNTPRPWVRATWQDGQVVLQTEHCTGIYAFWQNEQLSLSGNDNEWRLSLPKGASTEEQTYLRIYGFDAQRRSNELLLPIQHGQLIDDASKLAANDPRALRMYNVFLDRFYDGDSSNNHPVADTAILPKANFYGGDLKGLLQKLRSGYFTDLNINMIWLSPITMQPQDAWGQFADPRSRYSGYHGYWPVRSTTIDPRFGDEETLRTILEEAHAQGIQLILDYVANHVHIAHPVYKAHPDWVTPLYLEDGRMNTRLWDEQRLTTWFDTFLPSLNLEDQQVASFMVDSALYWLKNFDFDGIRHDATKHIPLSFQRLLTKRIQEEVVSQSRSVYQIGETYGSPELLSSYVGSGLLDGQFDFNLYDQALMAFAQDGYGFADLAKMLQLSEAIHGSHHLMGNITGNQDKVRFMSRADGSVAWGLSEEEEKKIGWLQDLQVVDSSAYDKMACFMAFNAFIPGVPIIYYGEEIGMPGGHDPGNRNWMRFNGLNGHEAALKQEVSDLLKMRAEHMPLLYGDLEIALDRDAQVLILTRNYLDQQMTLVINRSDAPYSYTGQTTIEIAPNRYEIITNN